VELALGLALVLEAGDGEGGAGEDGENGDGDDELDQGEAALSGGDASSLRSRFQCASSSGAKAPFAIMQAFSARLKPCPDASCLLPHAIVPFIDFPVSIRVRIRISGR
jgi:hypothetical protein